MIIGGKNESLLVTIEAGSMTFPNFYLLPLTTVDSVPSYPSETMVIGLLHAVIKTFLSEGTARRIAQSFVSFDGSRGKVVGTKKISASLQGHATSIQFYRTNALNGALSYYHKHDVVSLSEWRNLCAGVQFFLTNSSSLRCMQCSNHRNI